MSVVTGCGTKETEVMEVWIDWSCDSFFIICCASFSCYLLLYLLTIQAYKVIIFQEYA